MPLRRFSLRFFDFGSKGFPTLAFIIPLLVRALPEALMGGFIVGFDTVGYYVPIVTTWAIHGVGIYEFMAYAPLLYSLLSGLTLLGVPLLVSLKVLPPILHGFLGLTIFVYARKALTWSSKKSLFLSCLATLYFVALRISWDMLRSELALIFLFVFLTLLHGGWEKSNMRNLGLVMATMLAIVLSHQLVSVILFGAILALVLQKLSSHAYTAVRNLVLSALPAVMLFGVIVYSNLVVSSSSQVDSGWFSLFGLSSHSDIAVNTLRFLLYCYLPLLPFAAIGFRRFKNLELKAWLFGCLLGVPISLFAPLGSVPVSYRWILLLVFPMTFFAVEGFGRFSSDAWKKVFAGVFAFLSFSFILLPAGYAFPYFRAFPYYVPSSMLQNSVPLSSCEDVVKALSWVNSTLGPDAVLLTHDAFHGWALLYLDKERIVNYGYGDPQTAAEGLKADGFKRVYAIWWVSGLGWHGVSSLPTSFVEVFRSGEIAVYEFSPV